ncbi:Uncharacterised protein [Mycobacteroides abscessus subsp. massiliense]|nr:Uncharacterised protein [Mycobacteroides abscessus subsp. massiliense]SLH24358.1 Uncharacterised protein [Mycobacteroides abscessus subsp. massiliense]
MMLTAQRFQIIGTRMPTDCVWDAVIEVGTFGGLRAAGETARLITTPHEAVQVTGRAVPLGIRRSIECVDPCAWLFGDLTGLGGVDDSESGYLCGLGTFGVLQGVLVGNHVDHDRDV